MSIPDIDAPVPLLTTPQMVGVDRAMIGVPPSLYAGAGLGYEVGPVFATADIVRLR
jgi:hypothetical protein